MLRAYILAHVTKGKLREVLPEIQGLPGVLQADGILGPPDIIAVAEVNDELALGALVKHGFQSRHWIEKTVTCLATTTARTPGPIAY